MTNREFFTAISTASVSDELKAFALDSIAKLDARNEKRTSKPSKTALANEPIKASILELLANGAKVASEIGATLEISTNKASALCVQLAKEGKVIASEVKIPKKGAVKSYRLA